MRERGTISCWSTSFMAFQFYGIVHIEHFASALIDGNKIYFIHFWCRKKKVYIITIRLLWESSIMFSMTTRAHFFSFYFLREFPFDSQCDFVLLAEIGSRFLEDFNAKTIKLSEFHLVTMLLILLIPCEISTLKRKNCS